MVNAITSVLEIESSYKKEVLFFMQPFINPNYYSQFNTPYNPPTPNYAPSYQTTPPLAPQIAKMVPDFNNITVGDVPTNGTPGFFIKSDFSEIQSRQWTDDGRINVLTYKPAEVEEAPKADPFKEIISRLEAIEEKVTPKTTRKKVEAEE